jgi:hypothetical protein
MKKSLTWPSASRAGSATRAQHRIPFKNPSTPEEIRRNDVIIWVNSMQANLDMHDKKKRLK